MKSHERLKAEAVVEGVMVEDLRAQFPSLGDDMIYRSEGGDFLIEVKAHYMGSSSRRLAE